MRLRSEAGDTLVEVLIATAILGMAVVGALSAMSFGQGIALNAVERTEVQGSMNSQLSFLRYARDLAVDDDPTLWNSIKARAQSSAPGGDSVCNPVTRAPIYSSATGMFYIQEPTTAAPNPVVAGYLMSGSGVPKKADGIPGPGNGIWIDAVWGGNPPAPRYIDFYVKACWDPASGTTLQQSRTVMRLYVPEP